MVRRKNIPVIYRSFEGDTAGLAHSPDFGDDEIKIEVDRTLTEREKMRVLMHERLHILKPRMRERTVDEITTVLRDFLWARNYRMVRR